MDRRRYLRHWNSGIRIPDRTFVASYVCDLWCDAGIRTGTHLYRNYLDCSEMVPGKNGIRIRCGRNGKRTVWILSGTNQQKNPAAEGPGKTFLIIGAAITISWILCGIFFTAPDKEWRRKAERALREQNVANGNAEAQTEQKQYTSAEMMKTKNFYLLLATMLFGLISYFLVSPVSQTYQIELGIPSAIAVSAVMIGSIVNAGTRLVLPTLSDKVGRVGCIKGVLAVSVVAMAILTFTRSYTVTASIILMYGCYGGIMGSFPSFTSSIFGIEHTGENYGFVMLGIVIATCGAPALSGFITGKGYGMHVVFGMGIVFAVIALICLTILGHNLKKEEHGKEQKNNGISNDERITGACEE